MNTSEERKLCFIILHKNSLYPAKSISWIPPVQWNAGQCGSGPFRSMRVVPPEAPGHLLEAPARLHPSLSESILASIHSQQIRLVESWMQECIKDAMNFQNRTLCVGSSLYINIAFTHGCCGYVTQRFLEEILPRYEERSKRAFYLTPLIPYTVYVWLQKGYTSLKKQIAAEQTVLWSALLLKCPRYDLRSGQGQNLCKSGAQRFHSWWDLEATVWSFHSLQL